MSKKGSTPSSLEIHLLGTFRLKVDGRAVSERQFTRRKPKLLVKLLALQPHHQLHREQLMELLWPDSDMEAAANNLHKAIHLARHALEPTLKVAADSHFILTQEQQVSLRAPGELWIDVEAFEQAAAGALKSVEVEAYCTALALYGDDLLVEDLYEDWATARREQLRALHQSLLARLAHLYEMRSEYEQSIERMKELLACDASDEEVHRSLMRLYALTGNRHQALRQYQQCSEALRRELDVEPERATVKLYEQIAGGQLQPSQRGRAEHAVHRGEAIDSLAILPLANAGADLNVEYLSDGITEGIIHSLSQLSTLRVMAWSTVSRYKSREVNPQEVGRELGVRAVLTGRVRQLSDRLIVTTELVDARDGSHLWGEQSNL